MIYAPKPEDFSPIFENNQFPKLLYLQVGIDLRRPAGPHTHDACCEIIYVYEGEHFFTVNGKEYAVPKGHFVLIDEKVLHQDRPNPANPGKFYCLGLDHVHFAGMKPGVLTAADTPCVVAAGDLADEVYACYQKLYQECNLKRPGYDLVCNLTAAYIVILIHRILVPVTPSLDMRQMSFITLQAKEFIEQNYSQNITLSSLADRLFVSQNYLSHLFKRETGLSPINYLIKVRMGKAKDMLVRTQRSIGEISEQIGYENPSLFSMLFKKATDMTPGEYRQANTPRASL